MKRPASPSGAEHPGPRARRRAGRRRRWVPEGGRVNWSQPDPPPAPSRGAGSGAGSGVRWPPPDASAHQRWSNRDAHAYRAGDPPPPDDSPPRSQSAPGGPPPPRKITVTRVAAWRSRQLVGGGVRRFQQAATADGAGRSGLSSLTYAAMMDYAANAAIAVALANTLFFAAATAQSRANVALYLLITVAPFAVVAPVIGPLLDRLQHGRRVAMALSFAGRAFLLIVMAAHVHDWLLYPAALGFLVLAKSYGVLQAAVIPRVLPAEITLVKTNSRLTAFGLGAGAVSGAVAGGVAVLTGSPGALLFTAAICLAGVALCLRIPSWVEVTEGEVPASLRTETLDAVGATRRRQPMGRQVVVALWG
ncbi:MAG TPA: MFS transporter, partial [Pseudonocardiaceae bacterium]